MTRGRSHLTAAARRGSFAREDGVPGGDRNDDEGDRNDDTRGTSDDGEQGRVRDGHGIDDSGDTDGIVDGALRVLADAEEVDLTSSEESDCPRRRQAGRRRASVDTSGMSPEEIEEQKRKETQEKKAREKASRDKYREKRNVSAGVARADKALQFRLKPLATIATERGTADKYIQEGDIYDSKEEVIHRCRSVAEYLSLTICFPVSSRVDMKAVVEAFHGTGAPTAFSVHATFQMRTKKWHVKSASFSGERGGGPRLASGDIDLDWRKGHGKTAFSEKDLAFHTKNAILANPAMDSDGFVALFTDFLRYPDQLASDTWSRTRKQAYILAFGAPDDNIAMLPRLVSEMERRGHALEYTTYGGAAAVSVILSVRKAEADRLRKKAEKKPVSSRTSADEDDLMPWADQKERFLESHKTLLDTVNQPGLKYVDYMAFCFGFVKEQFPSFLFLSSVDACFAHHSLAAFQIFSMVGMSSNFNMIPLGYVLIVGNESGDTWTRALTFFRKHFPAVGRLTTVISDGDKGIPVGFEKAYPVGDRPHLVACAKHRGGNFAKFGRACVKIFYRLLKAPTTAVIATIQNSAEYKGLGQKFRTALQKLPDEKQYPASAVAAGATLYGKESSQGSESDNSAIKPARCLDPVRQLLWHGERAKRLYVVNRQKTRECQNLLPPRVKDLLDDIHGVGNASPVLADFTPMVQVYNVICDDDVVYRVSIKTPSSTPNESRFPTDCVPCTCGVPMRDRMPCGHMVAIADKLGLNPAVLVPSELTTANWVRQYTEGIVPVVPTFADLLSSSVEKDSSLRVPVAAPPKRGRPQTKRQRSAVEKITKRMRSNSGR